MPQERAFYCFSLQAPEKCSLAPQAPKCISQLHRHGDPVPKAPGDFGNSHPKHRNPDFRAVAKTCDLSISRERQGSGQPTPAAPNEGSAEAAPGHCLLHLPSDVEPGDGADARRGGDARLRAVEPDVSGAAAHGGAPDAGQGAL
eukprot:gene9941-biopygen12277